MMHMPDKARRGRDGGREGLRGGPSARPGMPRNAWLVAVILAAATVALYTPTLRSGFITTWDDGAYVVENANVQELTPQSVAWALTSADYRAGNWHPLTWFSHILDCTVYGLTRAWGHHLTSILLHALNAALVLFVLQRLTGRLWLSAAVAALWAVHPLRVESVAWISQRKDVLCATFFLAAIWAYSAYVARPSVRRYVLVALAFMAALMSKPMAVTLPLALLLLDWWPLGRLSRRAVVEKIPLMGMSAIACWWTLVAQANSGAIKSLDWVSGPERLANIPASLARYLAKMAWPWPGELSPLYPLARDGGLSIGVPIVASAVAVIVLVTVGAILLWRRRPYLLFGWLWFLGLLVPVIGAVQVGVQAMADRYTYLPMIGPLIAVAWLVGDLGANRLWARRAAAAAAIALLPVLAGLTILQERPWHDAVTFWQYSCDCFPRNALARFNLGLSYWGPKTPVPDEATAARALACYRQAVDLRPDWPQYRGGLADALAGLKRYDDAIREYRTILEQQPDLDVARINFGAALQAKGGKDNLQAAVDEYERVLKKYPGIAGVHENLARALKQLGRDAEAAEHFAEAARLRQ